MLFVAPRHRLVLTMLLGIQLSSKRRKSNIGPENMHLFNVDYRYWAINSVKVYQLEDSSASSVTPTAAATAVAATSDTAPSDAATSSVPEEHFSNTVSPEPTSLTSVMGASSILEPGMGATTIESASATSSVAFPVQTVSSGQNPYIIGNFFYLGCIGSSSGFPTFHQVSESAFMTPELCISQCGHFAYAGIYSNQCFCADALDSGTGVGTGNNICDSACPGDATEVCGGLASDSASNITTSNTTLSQRFAKRQTGALSSSILLTAYENIVEVTVGGIGSAISSILAELPSASSAAAASSVDASLPKVTVTLGLGPNFSSLLGALSTATPSDSDGVHYVPSSGSTSSPPLTTVVPASSLLGLGMGGAFLQVTEVTSMYISSHKLLVFQGP